MITSVGRIVFNSIVPEEFRRELPQDKPVGTKEVKDILQRIAEQRPEIYKDVSFKLLRLGGKSSVETGSSFSMADLASPIDKKKLLESVSKKEQVIFANKNLNEQQKEDALVDLYNTLSNQMPDLVFDASMKKGSNLARMVASGARGNRSQLNSNIGADFLVMDPNKRPVPIGIKHSYAEGMDPSEYFAAAYGTRAGLISTKFATQDSGFLAKQLSAAAMDTLITESDCETKTGIPVDAGDKDNVGALLAKDMGGYKAGTIITPKVMNDLKEKKIARIAVRSPMTCQAANGICSHCAGIRERNKLPDLSENIGLAAASALSEPLSQGMLGAKHTAGVANASKATGFKVVNSLFQVPEVYPDKATLSELDGRVQSIDKLPQGGFSVKVGDKEHYISPDHEIAVKLGDTLEAGDRLSSGLINPAEVVAHKGIGEGRLNLIKSIKDMFEENGIGVNRRNAEIVARSIVDHVKINDADESLAYMPDDIVEYGAFSKNYVPRDNSKKSAPGAAIGKYLESPVLHYSIGTRVTPSVVKNLEEFGENELLVHDESPAFEPKMVRLMENPSHNKDWMAQLGTSYVQKNLRRNVIRGDATSDIHGTHPLPALAYATEMGKPPRGTIGY